MRGSDDDFIREIFTDIYKIVAIPRATYNEGLDIVPDYPAQLYSFRKKEIPYE